MGGEVIIDIPNGYCAWQDGTDISGLKVKVFSLVYISPKHIHI